MSMLGGLSSMGGLGGMYGFANLGASALGAISQYIQGQKAAADNGTMLGVMSGASNAMGNAGVQNLPGMQYNASTGQLEAVQGGGPTNPMWAFAQAAPRWQSQLGEERTAALGGLESANAANLGDLQARAAQFGGQFDSFSGDLWGRQNARRAELTGALAGYGDQAKKDLNQTYTENAGSIQQSLASRGLGSTTMLPSMLTGNASQQADSMGRLNQQIGEQKLNVLNQLGGEEMNLANSLGTQGLNLKMGLQGDVTNAQINNRNDLYSTGMNYQQQMRNLNQNIDTTQLGMIQNAASGWLNTVAGVQSAYPDQGLYSQLMSNLGSGFSGQQALDYQNRVAKRSTGLFGLGGAGSAASMAVGLPLMATNMAAPGLGFALGAGLTSVGASGMLR